MRHNLKNIGFIGVMAMLLSACSSLSAAYHKQNYVTNRDYDYLKAKQVASLQVPPGVNGSQLGDDYPLPAYQYPVPTHAVSAAPPGL